MYKNKKHIFIKKNNTHTYFMDIFDRNLHYSRNTKGKKNT